MSGGEGGDGTTRDGSAKGAVAEGGTLAALDFPRVLEALAGMSQTPMGRARLLALRPIADRTALETQHDEVAEFREFMAEGSLPLGAAQPLEGALRAAAVQGTVLAFDDMVAAYRTAQVNQQVRRRLSRVDGLPTLAAIGARLPDLGPLVAQIERVFDEDGEVRDNASAELAALRRKKRKARERLLGSLETLVKDDKLDGVLRDRLVTQRGGRYVVPVQAGKRGALPGVVHDTSSSGQTIYVEPLALLDQQNAMVEVGRAEQREIHRLLADLTGHVRAAAGALAEAERAIATLDTRQAKARFAELTGGVRPVFSDGDVRLRGACHPLMIPALARATGTGDNDSAVAAAGAAGRATQGDAASNGTEDGAAVPSPPRRPVPLDFEIDAGTRTVVITGPNTGGKTVVLKVLGLACVLAQCGVPVPATDARLPCCPRVHADIGDEQSIIANLSTFSAHLTRIKRFLDDAPPGALVLLDELGTGTDPAEGAALGIAVLEHLAARGALTVASTHHDALKAFAHGAERAVNAAMEFSSETLQPTYRLRMGLPGRSNAFDIAAGLGLDETLVARARELLGGETAQLDSLIRSVEGEAEALASDRAGVQQEQDRLADAHRRYEELNRRLAELRDELAVEGRDALSDALAAVRRAGEELLDELAADLGETRKARAAQDRRAAWGARVGAAESEARKHIERSAGQATAKHADVVRAAEAPVSGDPEREIAADDRPDTPLARGEPVLVLPLNLRGKVARDWPGGGDADDEVEVDVHGKRIVVTRKQVHRRGR